MGVLEKADRAAIVHKEIELFVNLFSYIARKRYERKTAENAPYLAEAGLLMNRVCLAGICVDDLQIRVARPQRLMELFIQFEAEIRILIRNDSLNKFCDGTGADAKLENDVVLIGPQPIDHLLRKFGRTGSDRSDLCRIL